ncbi:hypothetical protein J6590_044675, partial [Homalodisca vitripennis]
HVLVMFTSELLVSHVIGEVVPIKPIMEVGRRINEYEQGQGSTNTLCELSWNLTPETTSELTQQSHGRLDQRSATVRSGHTRPTAPRTVTGLSSSPEALPIVYR